MMNDECEAVYIVHSVMVVGSSFNRANPVDLHMASKIHNSSSISPREERPNFESLTFESSNRANADARERAFPTYLTLVGVIKAH